MYSYSEFIIFYSISILLCSIHLFYCRKWEAIKAQFITSIAAFLGTFVGLYLQRNENAEKIMLSATSGGFLYIATVGILPAVINKESSLVQICLEGSGFLLGVAFMVGVAVLEDINH